MAPIVYELAYALYFILPAYVSNAIPVIFGGGIAIDAGKKLPDGRPIFGSHKTVRGFLSGLIAGTLTGTIQSVILNYNLLPSFSLPFEFNVLLGFMISLGAITGDLIHSFIKRRLNIPPGLPHPIADQLDFVIGGISFYFIIPHSYYPSIFTIAIIFMVTLPVHILTNFIAYKLGLKKNPL
jgi:CDP-2,3-bis-(O-geranylgeranyl)-sn-glycerol synthase